MTNMWPCQVPDGYIHLARIKPFPSEGSNHLLIDPNYPFPPAWMLYKLGPVLCRREERLICGNCPHITCTNRRDQGIPTCVGLFFFRSVSIKGKYRPKSYCLQINHKISMKSPYMLFCMLDSLLRGDYNMSCTITSGICVDIVGIC